MKYVAIVLVFVAMFAVAWVPTFVVVLLVDLLGTPSGFHEAVMVATGVGFVTAFIRTIAILWSEK